MIRMLGLTVAATLALGAAVAQADDNRGFYLGVNIGATQLDIDPNAYDAALSDALTQGGLTALSATSSRARTTPRSARSPAIASCPTWPSRQNG